MTPSCLGPLAALTPGALAWTLAAHQPVGLIMYVCVNASIDPLAKWVGQSANEA